MLIHMSSESSELSVHGVIQSIKAISGSTCRHQIRLRPTKKFFVHLAYIILLKCPCNMD